MRALISCIYFIVTIIAGLAVTGCIYEDRSHCQIEMKLYVRVQNSSRSGSGSDVGEASLFLFGEDESFMKRYDLSAEDIIRGNPIVVKYWISDRLQAVAWGNTQASNLTPETINDTAFEMVRNGEYFIPPGDYYYGSKQLSGQPVEEVIISPKNARMTIAAKGLDDSGNPDKYYYTIEAGYNGYRYIGNTIRGEVILKEEGIFDTNDYFITPDAFNLAHYPDNGPTRSTAEYVIVNLYEKAANPAEEGLLLASVTEDKDGKPIVPVRGKTTNVLIE